MNHNHKDSSDSPLSTPHDEERRAEEASGTLTSPWSEQLGFLSADAFLLTAAGITAIAGFLYGYVTGIISGALLQITQDFGLDHQAQELVTSAILVGAVVGALCCGKISGHIGRRYTIMLVALVFAVGTIASALSPSAGWLIVARLILGFAVGGSSQIVPVYIAELAPSDKRGRLVTFFNISLGVGILVASVVGAFLQAYWSWRTMFAVAAVPALILMVGMLPLPESPRWLIGHKRVREARHTLGLVRDQDREIRREITAIRRVHDRAAREARQGWGALGQKWLRPALIAGLGVAAFTQLSGIEMMIYYTPVFLSDAGFDHGAALYAALGVGVIYLIMTILGKVLVDHVGRRKLTLVMMPGAALSLVMMGAVFMFGDVSGNSRWWVVAALMAFMVFNAGGIQVIGWLLGSEVYPYGIREKATSLHAATLWGSNLLLTSTALTMVQWLSIGGAMWFYALLNVLGFLFVLFCVPETRGRSLEDIEQSLKDGEFYPFERVSS